MNNKIIILGSGAAPGVPSLSLGWDKCDSHNYKNHRSRTGTYYYYRGLRFLVDTSVDLRNQLLSNGIRELDFVLYTHAHADHINGIDDLREINRYMNKSLDIYANKKTLNEIKSRFGYLLATPENSNDFYYKPSLVPHLAEDGVSFYIKDVKITPIKLHDHQIECTGYVFDDGEVVHIADFKSLGDNVFEVIKKRPKVMIMPMTEMEDNYKHADLKQILRYVKEINPSTCIINHMSTSCDYDEVDSKTPDNVVPAYDNMIIEF